MEDNMLADSGIQCPRAKLVPGVVIYAQVSKDEIGRIAALSEQRCRILRDVKILLLLSLLLRECDASELSALSDFLPCHFLDVRDAKSSQAREEKRSSQFLVPARSRNHSLQLIKCQIYPLRTSVSHSFDAAQRILRDDAFLNCRVDSTCELAPVVTLRTLR